MHALTDSYVRERLGLPPLPPLTPIRSSDPQNDPLTSRTDPQSSSVVQPLPAVARSTTSARSARGARHIRHDLPFLGPSERRHMVGPKQVGSGLRSGRSIGKAPRFSAVSYPYSLNAAYIDADQRAPGPGAYAVTASVGKQTNSLRRNAPSGAYWAPEAHVDVAMPGLRNLEIQAARQHSREIRAKVSALLEQWGKAGEKRVSIDRLCAGLKEMGFELQPLELKEIFAKMVETADAAGNYDVKELHKALWNGKALVKRLVGAVEGSYEAHARLDSQALSLMRLSAATASDGESIKEQLRSHLVANGPRLIDMFRTMDLSGDGTVSRSEFAIGIKQFGVQVSTPELDALFDEWDANQSNSLELKELNHILRRGGHAQKIFDGTKQPQVWYKPRAAKPPQQSAEQEKLLTTLAANLANVQQLFAYIDTDGSGVISKREFRQALPLMHITAERAEVDALFERLDPDGDGELVLVELFKTLKWAYKQRKTRLLAHTSFDFDGTPEGAQDALRDALTRSAAKMMDVLYEWDADSNGMVSRREFRKALSLIGIAAPPDAVDTVFDSFDSDKSGEISIRELTRILRNDGTVKKKQVKHEAEEVLEVPAVDQLREEVYATLSALTLA